MTAERIPLDVTADTIIGENVHMLLFKQRMTQRELAMRLGVSDQTLGKKVKAISTFSFDELLVVAEVFGVPITEILPSKEYDPVIGNGRRRGRFGAECASRDSNPEPAD